MVKFDPPSPILQISFFKHLQALKDEILLEGLLTTIKQADTSQLDKELHQFVPEERLRTMRSYALPGEVVFATPYILTLKPMLLGYYRLLLGLSQKSFYTQGGYGVFRAMEESNSLSLKQQDLLPDLCIALNESTWRLIRGIEVELTNDGIRELTLITLGPQLRGSNNNKIGTTAAQEVFDYLQQLLAPQIVAVKDKMITIKNAAGREVVIEFATDPDIVIYENIRPVPRKLLSIEIKGGTDVSNLHNRLGEAEKSHLKAKAQGYKEFWTLLRFKGFDRERAQMESPSTRTFYDISNIYDLDSEQGKTFSDELKSILGL